MLSRFGQPRVSVNGYFQVIRRFASSGQPAAYTEWAKRYDSLVQANPRLFSGDFVKDQESILSKHCTKDNLGKLLQEYDGARKAIDDATGESVFLEYDLNEILNTPQRPVQTTVQSKDEALAKLTKGTNYVTDLLAAQGQKTNTVEETNLKMIKIADFADAIDYWRARLPDGTNDNAVLQLPITDPELDKWVEREYFHAPEEVRVQSQHITFEEHRQIEEEWMHKLDEKLIQMLKQRDSSLDEKRLRTWIDTSNELFHPFKIDHYTFSNYSKQLFRAALWESKQRLDSVESGVRILRDLLNDNRDNDALILRTMYEEYPESPFGQLAALQLKMTDPLFGARIVDEARNRLEQISFERAIKDVLRELELPYLKSEKTAAEKELAQSSSGNPAVLLREIRLLDAETASYDMTVPTLEAVLDELLPKRLWGKDVSKVKTAILAYSSGKGSLDAVNQAIEGTLQPSAQSGKLSDDEILQLSVRYHNARYSDISYWNFSDFMMECSRIRKEDFLLNARRIVKDKLEGLGCDPMVINMVRLIIENSPSECNRLRQVVADFDEILKQYRGEIDALVTSAEPLDDGTFNQLLKALESANPGKKITMERAVDPGLQAGFVVKAGTQRFDYSLASAIYEGKRSVAVSQ